MTAVWHAVLAWLVLSVATTVLALSASVAWGVVRRAVAWLGSSPAAVTADERRAEPRMPRPDTIADRCPQGVVDRLFAEITDCPVTEQLHEGTDR